MFDYADYLQNSDALSFAEASEIYQSLLAGLATNDEYLIDLWQEIIHSAVEYVLLRTQWNYYSREEKQAHDSLRTSYHNDFIINLKAFYQMEKQLDIDSIWLAKLGPSEKRKRWGDLAGYLLCFENLRAR